MTPREQVMATIRRSLGVSGGEAPRRKVVEDRLRNRPAGVIPARATGKTQAERVKLFVEMAEASAATVAVVGSAEDAPAAIADFLRDRNLAFRLRRGDDPRLAAMPWAGTALEVSIGRSHGDDETAVSAATAGVAETGTLVLVSGPENPTTLNFLPDAHVVVLEAGDVSATYEDVWARLRSRFGEAAMPRTVNWITGPSRSADIEQILLMGAHGPRRLHIVLIDPNHQADGAEGAVQAPAGSTPSPAVVRSTLGGEKTDDAFKPKESEDSEKSDADKQDDLDEELDESFPASDPPSQTQP